MFTKAILNGSRALSTFRTAQNSTIACIQRRRICCSPRLHDQEGQQDDASRNSQTQSRHVQTSYQTPSRPHRIVVGITGATGTVYAIRLLEILKHLNIETHLIVSKWGLSTLKFENSVHIATDLSALATKVYSPRDVSAAPASGSFQHDGMIIVPCSMKTLAAVRVGFGEELIARAADVSLKEDRKLVLVVRKTPLSAIHLENMLALRRTGAMIFPPVPAFYTHPQSLDDVVEQSVGRILDSMGIHVDTFPRWKGSSSVEKGKGDSHK